MADYRHQLEKIRSRAYIWVAWRIPQPIVQMSLLNAGWRRIRRDEVVTDVTFTDLLGRRDA
jgi:hypothetical protein